MNLFEEGTGCFLGEVVQKRNSAGDWWGRAEEKNLIWKWKCKCVEGGGAKKEGGVVVSSFSSRP